MEIVRGHFRPEFLNRLDEIILFHRLGQSEMAPIVGIQVARVQKLLADRKVTLDLTDGARAWLGRVGYDPVYGARPLKRAVQRYLQDPLADLDPARRREGRIDGQGRRGRRQAGACRFLDPRPGPSPGSAGPQDRPIPKEKGRLPFGSRPISFQCGRLEAELHARLGNNAPGCLHRPGSGYRHGHRR